MSNMKSELITRSLDALRNAYIEKELRELLVVQIPAERNEVRDLFIRLQAGTPLTAQEKREVVWNRDRGRCQNPDCVRWLRAKPHPPPVDNPRHADYRVRDKLCIAHRSLGWGPSHGEL